MENILSKLYGCAYFDSADVSERPPPTIEPGSPVQKKRFLPQRSNPIPIPAANITRSDSENDLIPIIWPEQ